MTSEPIRLALRVEGDWWVAYIAETGRMDGAIEIGRVLLNAVSAVDGGTDRFKTLMVDALAAHLKGLGLKTLGWSERAAPESERSGKA